MKHIACKLLYAALACLFGTSSVCAQQQTDVFQTKSGKELKLTCIKHATIQMEYDGRFFYFDPVTGLKPETDFTTMPRANYIFITHEHPDHFDRMAIAQLVCTSTVTYTNQNVHALYRDSYVMHNGDSISIAPDLQVKAVPAYNTTPDRTKFHPRGRDNGFILTVDGLRIYVAGDTEDVPEMADIKDIDIAFLPCNQPYTMTVEQLVKAAKLIRPRVLFPYHYSDTPIGKVKLLLSGSGIDVRIRKYQ